MEIFYFFLQDGINIIFAIFACGQECPMLNMFDLVNLSARSMIQTIYQII